MAQDTKERKIVKIEMALAVNVDVGPNHPTEDEVTQTLEAQIPMIRDTLLKEFRRLVDGGALSDGQQPRLVQ
jgi:hypothetical protein